MNTLRIRIGLQIAQYGAEWSELLGAAKDAETIGADVLFSWDHFFGPKDSDVPNFECWTTLAAWAASTSRITLGPLVSCIGYRNPDLVADMARTVDHISGGRVILGLGSGFKERDYVEYGYEFGTVASRVDDLDHGVKRIKRRLGRLNPPPVKPVPLLIAASGEQRALRIVAIPAAHNFWTLASRCSSYESTTSTSRTSEAGFSGERRLTAVAPRSPEHREPPVRRRGLPPRAGTVRASRSRAERRSGERGRSAEPGLRAVPAFARPGQ